MKHDFFSEFLCIVIYSHFLHNLCVLNSNLLNNIQYFGVLHLQISKTQIGCQNVKRLPYFYGLSHMKAQFIVSARFLLYTFLVVSFEINNLYLTFKYNISVVFYICIVTVRIPLNTLTLI